jgi:hypothetical protein
MDHDNEGIRMKPQAESAGVETLRWLSRVLGLTPGNGLDVSSLSKRCGLNYTFWESPLIVAHELHVELGPLMHLSLPLSTAVMRM